MTNTAYPGAIDTFTDPTTNDTLATVPHHLQHGLANDALAAVETKLGTGASLQTPTTNGFLVGTGAGASNWQPSPTSPSFTTSILDTNNKTWIGQTSAGSSAVNYINISNSVTGSAASFGAAGSDSNISTNITSKGSGKVQDNGSNLVDFRASFANFIQTGAVWSVVSGLAATMTLANIWINGVEYALGAVGTHTFGASNDTYVDYTVGSGITYTPVSNSSVSPSLAANSVRIAIIVAGSSTISSINQGNTSATAPVVSSNILTVTDSLGNLIYPSDPTSKLLGYRSIASNFTTTTSGSYIAVTGLSAPYINPTGRRIKAIFSGGISSAAAAGAYMAVATQLDGSSIIGQKDPTNPATSYIVPFECIGYANPTAGSHTIAAYIASNSTSTLSLLAGNGAYGSAGPVVLSVELA